MSTTIQTTAELCHLTCKVGLLYSKRLLDAQARFMARLSGNAAGGAMSSEPATPWDLWQAWASYGTDLAPIPLK